MTLTKQTMVVLKRKYKGMLNKFMSTEDRFAVKRAEYDELLDKLMKAHTDLNAVYNKLKKEDDKFEDTDNAESMRNSVSSIEEKMKVVYNKINELNAKEKEYVAKIESAVALNEAAKICSSINSCSVGSSIGDIIKECDDLLNKLDAELDTLNFVSSLGK